MPTLNGRFVQKLFAPTDRSFVMSFRLFAVLIVVMPSGQSTSPGQEAHLTSFLFSLVSRGTFNLVAKPLLRAKESSWESMLGFYYYQNTTLLARCCRTLADVLVAIKSGV